MAGYVVTIIANLLDPVLIALALIAGSLVFSVSKGFQEQASQQLGAIAGVLLAALAICFAKPPLSTGIADQIALMSVPNKNDPTFNAWEDIKGTKYEAYFDSFLGARNHGYAEALKARVDQKIADCRVIVAATNQWSRPDDYYGQAKACTSVSRVGTFFAALAWLCGVMFSPASLKRLITPKPLEAAG